MKTRHVVALAMLAGAAIAVSALEGAHAEDTYIRNLPLDPFVVPVPVPVIPPGSTLDLRPARAPDAAGQMMGDRPGLRDQTTPGIGLSIKSPFEERR
ncbi:MAG TPA: hypothetical protein VGF53_15735 [Pseudolabrys sp.]|jgi:hypothetical protein